MDMRRIIFCLFFLLTVMMGFSKVTKPDFAFPKTVANDAYADLKKANASHDAHAALNALIRITVAEDLIDNSTLQATIRLVEQTSQNFKDDKLYGLFPALISKLYSIYYARDSWTYNRRETPLEPYPSDISEWSGKQFEKRIAEAIRESISGRCAKELGKLPIQDYTDLITTGQLTTTYYPTLLDFCYVNALEDVNSNSDLCKSIRLQAFRESPAGSAPNVLWMWEIESNNEDNDFDSVYEKAKEYSGNKYAGMIFADRMDLVERDNNEEKRKYIELAEEYIRKFNDSPFKDVIKDCIESLKTPQVMVEMTNHCSPGHSFDVRLTSFNAENIALNVYYSGAEQMNVRNAKLYDTLLARKPEKTVTLKFNEAVPFRSDTIISLTLDKTGYYYVMPVFGNKNINTYQVNTVRCIPVFPIAVKADNLGDVITVEPYSGKPMENVGITLTNRYRRNKKETVNCGTTDTNGILSVLDKMNRDDSYHLTATTGGKLFEFENVTIYRTSRHNKGVEYNANVLTDRLLYHPGDNAEILVVMSEATPDGDSRMQQMLCEKMNISIMLFDANYQPVDTVDVTTDDWGRATATFKLPTDGLTGNFNIRVKDKTTDRTIGNHSIMVSDYRMPDFEIKIDETACDEPSKGFVTIKGTATSYSGMPMADAEITLNLSESSWGWWRWHNQEEKIFTKETTTNPQGKFTFVVPDSVLADREKLYMAAIEGVSVTGSTAQASTTFSLSKRYKITVNLSGSNIDGEKPLRPDIKVYAPDGSTVDIPLEWALVHYNDTTAFQPFNGEIDLSKTKPDVYSLIIRSVDSELAEPASSRITVYNKSTDIVPCDYVLWAPVSTYTANADGEAEVTYANAYDDTYIYCYLTSGDKTEYPVVIKARKGYNTFRLKMGENAQTTVLRMYAVKHGELKSTEITVKSNLEKTLRITGESFRDNLIPGARETWKIRITDGNDNGCQSALVLDMYNKALDAVEPQRQSLNFPSYDYTSWLSISRPNFYNQNCNYEQKFTWSKNVRIKTPAFNFYNKLNAFPQMLYGYSRAYSINAEADFEEEEVLNEVMTVDEMKAGGTSVVGYGTTKKTMADLAAPMPETAQGIVATAEGAYIAVEEKPEVFDYRDSDVPMAIWAPTLTTDKDGGISYTFTVPNANTTWRLQAVAWSRDMEVGSMMRDFVASKPVMVQPNLPRFLRNGDEVAVVASVMNNTDEEQKVTTTVEIFNPLTNDLLKTKTFTQTIAPKGYDKVNVKLYAEEDVNAIGYRIRSTNGEFTDGEQSVIRVLPSEQSLIETSPFYLNPGEKEYTTTLPSDEGARLSLTFCENPAWTIVSALPGLRSQIQEYANSAAAAIYSSAIARGIVKDNPKIGEVVKSWLDNPEDSALVSMLEKNEDLKIAVLSATPWVSAAQTQNERMANLAMIFNDNENAKTINAAIKILKDLQNNDGGWAWAKWCKESSVWTTSNVLAMLGDLRRIGWMPADKELSDMVSRAVKYYDEEVEKTDLIYCLVRPLFASPVSANGKKVINATLAEIKKNWKSYSDPAYKAMAAQALYLNGDKKMAGELMRSLSEFGVTTKNQGLKFPNVNALYSYAILLDAYAMVRPESAEVDGLRQQLIVRKQGTDWGDAVVTMEVVKAILTSGSTWTVDAEGANVTAGGQEIMPKGAEEKATGSFTADLSDYAGKELTVTTSGVGPAYGAVYSQFNRQMDKVEASGCDDLDIEKQLFVRRGMDWEVADTLKVGDRVKVQLTIHCKRNLQYVEIIDKRPAAFEPVKQLPGWEWSEGVGFYRENRDSETDLHVVYMAPGTYLLTYEMNVNLAGSFTSGVASIQSQYAPEISAHSGGCTLKVRSDRE